MFVLENAVILPSNCQHPSSIFPFFSGSLPQTKRAPMFRFCFVGTIREGDEFSEKNILEMAPPTQLLPSTQMATPEPESASSPRSPLSGMA